MSEVRTSVGRASLILVLGFIGSRALGVLRNMILAQAFGTGPELDAYFAAFRVPDAIFQLIAGAALGSAFIPTFASLYSSAAPARAWRLASATLNLISLTGAVSAAIAFVLAPWLVPWTVVGFSPESQELTITLTRIMLLSSAFFCASGMITGVLNARFHFVLPALAPWLYNLSIIGGTVLLGERMGVLGPAWGVSLGAGLHLLVQLPGLRSIGMRYTPALDLHTAGVSEVLRLMGPRVLTLGSAQVNWIITTMLASTLEPGSVTALSYGWAVVMLPLGLFGMAPATAAFPALASAAAERDWKQYRDLLAAGMRRVLFLSVPGSIGVMLVREPLIRVLFERGQFDEASSQMTATALLFFAGGLFAHALLEVVARGSYALHDTRTPLLFALAGTGSHALLSLLFLALGWGIAGLALSMSLAALVESGGLLLALSRRIGYFDWPAVASSAARTLAASSAMAAAVVWLLRAVHAGPETPAQLYLLVLAGAAGGAVFFAAAGLLRSPDILELLPGRLRRGVRL